VRIAFAGDRNIGVAALRLLLDNGIEPVGLMLSGRERQTHAVELRAMCCHLPEENVLHGVAFRTEEGMAALRALDLDYVLCVHFPYIVPPAALAIPRVGFLNLHPAFLPFGRGWHTVTWAILEDHPIGATLHFMDEGVDTGDIILQRPLEVTAAETAEMVYPRVKELEVRVLEEALPMLLSLNPPRMAQDRGAGSTHLRGDLLYPAVQKIESSPAADAVLRKLRALTTGQLQEAAYVEVNGRRYRIQVRIDEEIG
jgi:methionyl-tRNA formyltransferase